MAKAKIPGTIYSLIFRRASDYEFELSLELRGNIETTAKVPELDTELVVQAALRMISEYRIPASESAIQSLAAKLTRRFSKRPKTLEVGKQAPHPETLEFGKQAPRPVVAPELKEIVETPKTKVAPSDPEVIDLVAQLDAIKGEEGVQETESLVITPEMPADMADELKKIISRVSRFIQPLQDEVKQFSERLTQLEANIPGQDGIAALEQKLQAMESKLEKVEILETAFRRIETQIPYKETPKTSSIPNFDESVVQGPPVPTSQTVESETDRLSSSIMRSESFQDLLDFSDKLDKATPSVEAPGTAQDLVPLAQDLWKDGRRQQAIQLLETAAREHQTDPELLLLLGRFHSHKGHIHEAVDAYDRALSFFPDDIRVLLALGDAYIALDLCEEAIKHLKRAQDLDPDNATVRARISSAYLRMGQQAEAMEELKSFVEDSPDSEHVETDVGHSSEPLSLEALKRADVAKKATQQAQDPSAQGKAMTTPEDVKRKKQHLKTLLDIEAKKSDD